MRTILLLATLVATTPAFAGTFTAPGAPPATTPWSFDLRLVVAAYPSRAAVDDAAHRCVTWPNIVCVVVDPVHRHTATHFGEALGVRPSDFSRLAAAGNARFKVGDWAGGARAIGAATAVARAVTTVAPAPPPPARVVTPAPPADESSFPWAPVLVLLGIGVAITVLLLIARHRDRMDEEARARARSVAPRFVASTKCASCAADVNFLAGQYDAKCSYCGTVAMRARPPAPTPVATTPRQVVVMQAGPSVVVHHDTSAADTLLAYEIGRSSAPREVVREVEVIRESPRYDPPSYDGGGSSSDYDDSPSVDFDSGGGDSDF